VYFGSATGPNATNRIELTCSDDTFGSAVLGIGDFDDAVVNATSDPNKYPDLAVAAMRQDRVYIWRGRSTMGSGNLDCSTADITIIGPSGSGFGDTISAIGDFDGDGKRDIAIGAPYYDSYNGTIFVVFGRDFGTYPVTINLESGLNAYGAIRIDNLAGVVGLGQAGADLDGDGLADLLFAALFGGTDGHGVLHRLNGFVPTKSQNTLTVLTAADLDQSVSFTGPVQNASFFGTISVSPMDYDGDGCLDVAVGVAGANINQSGGNRGDVVVYRGVSSGSVCSGSLETAPWASMEGDAVWDLLGLPLAQVLDMTGTSVSIRRFNGILMAPSDCVVLAGAAQHNRATDTSTGSGYAALWYAGVSGSRLAAGADIVFSDSASGGEYHWTNMVGDLDGDGYTDIAVADTFYGTAGRIRVFH